ncbi:hypothetical protein J6590_003290 [Homalodisca vitripennis]|nr:hypothetical protein J6590_003290 [Homalodisca vitripennis]
MFFAEDKNSEISEHISVPRAAQQKPDPSCPGGAAQPAVFLRNMFPRLAYSASDHPSPLPPQAGQITSAYLYAQARPHPSRHQEIASSGQEIQWGRSQLAEEVYDIGGKNKSFTA